MLQARKDAGGDEARLLFGEAVLAADVVSQVSTLLQLQHKVQTIPVLESVPHVHDEPMLQQS